MAELVEAHRVSIIIIAIFFVLFLSVDSRAQTASQVSCEPCFTISRQQFVSYDIQTKTLTLNNPGVNCIIRDQIRIFGVSSGRLSVPLGSLICGNQTYNISGLEPNTRLTISFEDSTYHIYAPGPDSAIILVNYYVDVLFPTPTASIEPNKSTTVNFTIRNNQDKDDVFSIEMSQISGVSIDAESTRLSVKANSSATTTMAVTNRNTTDRFELTLIARSATDGNVYGTGKLEFIKIQAPIPTTTSISPQVIQNQTNVSSNETSSIPLLATLQSFGHLALLLVVIVLPIIFYAGTPRLATKFNIDLSRRIRESGTIIVFLVGLLSYTLFLYPLYSLTLMIVLPIVLMSEMAQGVINRCPKCGKWFGRTLLSQDIVDQKIFAHGTVTLYENHYICKSCSHKWSTRSEHNKVRWGSDRERGRRWAKWLEKPLGHPPRGYRRKDFF